MNSAQQQYTPPDGEGHIRKKPRKYKFLDKGAPFRAIVAHQYRQYYRNQTKTTTDIKWFLSYIVPHIPGANVQYDPPFNRISFRFHHDDIAFVIVENE